MLHKVIILIILISGLLVGLYLLSQQTNLFPKAAPQITPQEVKISNLSDNSFTVSWVTPDKPTIGFVSYGQGNLTETALDDRDTAGPKPRTTHHITLKNLIPQTTYLFKISSAGQTFDNNGQPYSVTTTPTTQDTPPLPQPIFGKVKTADSKPPQEAVVYVEIGEGTLLSSYTRADGNWLVTLNNARTKDLSTYLTPQDQDRVAVTIQAGIEGFISKATTLAKKNELSAITLNKTSAPQKPSAVPGDLNGDGVVNAFDLIFTVQKGLKVK